MIKKFTNKRQWTYSRQPKNPSFGNFLKYYKLYSGYETDHFFAYRISGGWHIVHKGTGMSTGYCYTVKESQDVMQFMENNSYGISWDFDRDHFPKGNAMSNLAFEARDIFPTFAPDLFAVNKKKKQLKEKS